MRRSVGSAAVEASVPNDGAAVEEAARTEREGGKHSIFIGRAWFRTGQQRSCIALAQSATLRFGLLGQPRLHVNLGKFPSESLFVQI